MTNVTLTVNGTKVTADVEARMHLADFLREDRLLTGTHLGCEHGVCGACTLLIDGAPARSCIAFAVTCDGADVLTIEGLDNDRVIVQLRAAFTAEHALQCGYCTPGMLITARDIVLRLPDADEARIRLELAGNLCRCTGYLGIVRAIQRVLAEGVPGIPPAPRPLPALPPMPVPTPSTTASIPGGMAISQTLSVALPISAVWQAMQDPSLIAACVPGAHVTAVEGDRLRGEMRAALGPIETLFTGEGRVVYGNRQAEIIGECRDQRTGTRLTAHVIVRLRELDAASTEAAVAIDHALRGPLAQFARGAVVQQLAAAIAAEFITNLEARIRGLEAPISGRLSVGTLMLRALWRRLLSTFRRQ